MAKVLIAGCGYVGTALAHRLLECGHGVWGLRRQAASLAPGIEPLTADLTRPSTLGRLPQDPDFVFYTAAASSPRQEDYRLAYVVGLKNLLAALGQGGRPPRRIFFTSSTGVYGQSSGRWVDETSPTEPTSYRGGLVLEGERVLQSSAFPATVVRLGGIYGPGRTRFLDAIRQGGAQSYELAAGVPAYTNRIHRDDCAGALLHLMELSEPQDVYVGVDQEPAELKTVVSWLASRLGVALPPARPLAGDEAERSNKRCRNARLVASGYSFRYPSFREGYGEMLQHDSTARSSGC